ncbi:MAG TPA: hypothetical protein VHC48_12850 [Puia sp.]|nr:hypothetical protein [Puia sp.]
MLKRLTLVALFTGSAQLATLLALKYLSGKLSAGQLSALGEIDSLINLIVNLVALGLLLSSVRDIALSPDWETEIDKTQTARLTFSLCLVPLSLYGLYDHNYSIFLFAPIFALNADYALYGRSHSVLAAFLSFLRVTFPFLAVFIVILFYPDGLAQTFFLSSVIIYFFVGFFIARFFRRPYLPKPAWKSLKLYWKSLDLGVAGLAYYFIGLGLIPIAARFYNDDTMAIAYVGCKMYMIFKGVLRIISQSFVKEMIDAGVQLQVDRLAGFAGFFFLAAAVFYPSTFIRLFLNKALSFDHGMLVILAVAGLLAAILLSYPNKAILEKNDRPYSIVMAIGAVAAIGLCIVLSFFSSSPVTIFVSILAGETVCLLGLIKLCGSRENLGQRSLIWLKYAAIMGVPLAVRLYGGDSYIAFFSGMGTMAALFLLIFYKKLRLK